jgi:hypothetical protein
MSYSGDIDVASIGTLLHLRYLVEHYFSVNFHFLKNNKSYSRDFFTIDTIDDALCFRGIGRSLSPQIFGWYHMPFCESVGSCIGQVSHISGIDYLESSHLVLLRIISFG